jgi:hypothetical protein
MSQDLAALSRDVATAVTALKGCVLIGEASFRVSSSGRASRSR